MRGCIIRNNRMPMKEIFCFIEGVEEYNWLITNIECFPRNKEIAQFLQRDYCWITGEQLLKLVHKEDFQWIWGVFSAFQKDIEYNMILRHPLPFADGYIGFWQNPITIQHPLADMEIVSWDGSLILVISKQNKIIDKLIKEKKHTLDLEKYNDNY